MLLNMLLPLPLLLTLTAFFTSALSGVAGLGGGTILIAVIYTLGLAPVQAIPLFAAVQFVSNTTRTVAYIKDVEWPALGWFLLACVPATLVLAPYAAQVDGRLVKLLLALLILASLLPAVAATPLPARPAFVAAGLANGALGLFVGATGLFVGRLFFRPEWPKAKTVATLAMTQMFGHGLRVLAYGAVGFSAFGHWQLLLPLCAAVVLGTLVGKRLNGKLSERAFKTLFQTLLVALSLKLLIDALLAYNLLNWLWN